MIVSMKKITLVVQAKDTDSTLKTLRNSGILHIEHQRPPKSESISELEERYRNASSALNALPEKKTGSREPKDPEALVSEILELISKKDIAAESLKKIKREINAWEEWGDFDPEIIDDLRSKNIWVRLCKVTKKEILQIPDGVILEEIFRKGNIIYCVALSREEISLPFSVLPFPEKAAGEMLIEKMAWEQRISHIDERLKEISVYRFGIVFYKKRLESLMEFEKAGAGMGNFQSLAYLIGYCPDYNVNLLEKIAEKEKWGIIIEGPGENDNVPTLIKNPRWVKVIKPVLQMIKTVPGYKEVDISFWFLLFFSVFFGILVGDAGYGMLFLLTNVIAHAKLGKSVKDKSIFYLTYVLSISTIIWGLMTGTFFGQAYMSGRVKPLLPYLSDNTHVQSLCFLIGAIHLSIAHAWRFIRKFPSLKTFAEAGWIAMLWAAYFIAKYLILGEEFNQYGKWLFISGASMVILFTDPSKNIFKGIGSGIGGLLLNAVNSFTDVVSYIRLFAVGAASVAVADAFNNIAATMGYGSFLSGFASAMILLFGHTLNIALGAMAVLVHGLRLNMLEFSSHLNMEWSGVEYTPFKQEVN